jgi:murein DD-endopeptidase MepM/ murein hydrolase activator NlpD
MPRRFYASCILKAILLLFVSAAFINTVSATEGTWKCSDYSLWLSYNKEVQPGDALFLRLRLTPLTNNLKKNRGTCSGKITLSAGEWSGAAVVENSAAGSAVENGPAGSFSATTKTVGSALFYQIAKKTPGVPEQSYRSLLAGIPLSSYCKPGNYTLTVTYSAFGILESKFTLPVVILSKEFVKETIPLDNKNTSIKTDTSKERIKQIDRLNAILAAINNDDVYQTEAFVPPAQSTRRTSFFADRRIYAYSDGKSSTSLHYGIDYGIPAGTPVCACGNGKVVLAENRISTGWSVCIEHLPGLYSLYYHMDSLLVQEGQIVCAGQQIGNSGCTGLATGPHLHWEIRLNMEAVSPDFFTGDFTFEKAKVSR